jgi:hypothetical protein
MQDTVERRSRLVSLAYEVLGTIDLPPLDASEGEVLAALASAFHCKSPLGRRSPRLMRPVSPIASLSRRDDRAGIAALAAAFQPTAQAIHVNIDDGRGEQSQ